MRFSQSAMWAATCNRVSISANGSATQCTSYECIGYRPSGDLYYDYSTDIVDVGVAGAAGAAGVVSVVVGAPSPVVVAAPPPPAPAQPHVIP
jgi:hypothetical protein